MELTACEKCGQRIEGLLDLKRKKRAILQKTEDQEEIKRSLAPFLEILGEMADCCGRQRTMELLLYLWVLDS